MTEVKYTYDEYAEDVLTGKIVANKYIKQACERYKSWLNRSDIYFDEADVQKRIRFIFKMKHTTGAFAGKNFELLPWQQFALSQIFGWKYTDNNKRVTQNVLLFMARKAGKTSLIAAIVLCAIMLDNEQGAEIDCLANNVKQANILLQQAQEYAKSLDPRGKVFHPFRSLIKVPQNKSFIQVLSSDSNGLDGFNASCGIFDEFHSQRDWKLYNVIKSSQGFRENPLLIVISTAGFYLDGFPLYDMTAEAKEVLAGLKKDDRQFSLIYTLDEDDDYTDENVWIKANPSLGSTVSYEWMRGQIKDAQINASLEVGVKTKNLNMWCQSVNTWLSNDLIIDNSEKIDLKFLKDEEAYMGVDLASVSDLAASSIMFPPNENRTYHPDKYIFHTDLYLPQEALETSTNAELYKIWIREGYLKMTSGNVIDYDYILADQLKLNSNHLINSIAYDTWNSTSYAINAEEQSLPMEPYSQALGNFNRPTKEFEILLKRGKVIIDYNPVIAWMFRNVELKYDFNENAKPIKSQNIQTNKIDGVISMLEALGIFLQSPKYDPTVFAL